MADPTTPLKSRQDRHHEDLRFRTLRALAGNPGLSQRGLADAVGISLGAANGLVNAMIEAGLVKIQNAGAPTGRFRFAYVLTAKGKTAKTRLAAGFLARRRSERAALDREIEALESELDQPAGAAR